MRVRALIATVSVLFTATLAVAQPLADRVPEDSLLYIGWRGSADPGAAYQGSHLKALVDNSNLPELFNEFFPQVFAKIEEKNPNDKPKLEIARTLLTSMLKYPSALFVETIDMANPQKPVPRLGILCRAGEDAGKLEKAINDVLASGPPPQVPVKVVNSKGVVALLLDYPDAAVALAGEGAAKPLAGGAAFSNALKQVQSDPTAIAYFDFDKLLRILDDVAAANPDPGANEGYLRIREASGLAGLKRFIWTAGFDGTSWGDRCFIEAPAPRNGLLTMLDVKPVSPDLLKAIPSSATFAASAKIDPARFLTQLREIAGKIDISVQQKYDQGIAMVQMMLGKNLITDILDPLGEDWAIYTSPEVGGDNLPGIVLINKLDDPEKALQGLTSLNMLAASLIAMQSKNAEVQVTTRTAKFGDLGVTYWALPFVSPSWAIKNGYLYVALYPQNVAAAIDAQTASASGGKSLLDNPKYQGVQKRLGVTNAISIGFSDLPATAPQNYPMLLSLERGLGFADLLGVPVPEPVLPSLPQVMKHVEPSGSASWVDDSGWHSRSITPFPGATLMSNQQAQLVGSSAVIAGITLPSVARARETATRVSSASNLRQIGSAILFYANENKGKYPPDMGTLATTIKEIPPNIYVSQRTKTAVPANLAGPALAQWVNINSDYIYLGAGKDSHAGADVVIVYENPSRVTDGINMLYGDGHVEFQTMPMARQQLEKQGVTTNLPQ